MAAENATKPLAASAMVTRRSTTEVGTTSPNPRVVSAAPLMYRASAKPRPRNGVAGAKENEPMKGR